MLATINRHPSLTAIVNEWETYCIVADQPQSQYNQPDKYTGKRNKLVWDLVDKSLPIPLGDELWFIRVLSHKTKGLCIDIRQFDKYENDTQVSYVPSDNGIVLPVKFWGKILDPLIKLLKKHREK